MTINTESSWTLWLAVRRVFGLVRDHFAAFFIVALSFNIPLTLAQLFGVGQVLNFIVAILCGIGLAICFSYGSIQAMNRTRPNAIAMLRQVTRRDIGKLLTLGLIQTIAIVIGSIALVLPGLLVLARWMVAVPAMIAEDTDITASLKRSSDLTQDRRWRVLGVWFFCSFSIFAAYLVLFIPILGAFGIGIGSTAFITIGAVTGSLVSMIIYSVPPVLYLFLRQEKEGTAPESIAAAIG